MGVASGCGEQEVGVASGSGWNLWVWLLGVGLRRYIDFLILLIPILLLYMYFFAAASLLFLFIFLNVFRSCINYSMILNNYKKNECACHESEIITFLESLFPYT